MPLNVKLKIIAFLREFFYRVIHRKKAAVAALAFIVLLSFYSAVDNDFVLDDFDNIVDSPSIKAWSNLPLTFTSFIPNDSQSWGYAPVKTLLFAINYYLWKDIPMGYIFTSLLIHLMTVLFVYKLTGFLTRNRLIAFFTALTFGIHPVQAESVTHISNGLESVGVLFLLLSFYFYVSSSPGCLKFIVEENGNPPAGKLKKKEESRYFISFLLAGLSIFTFELGLCLPLLFLLYELYREEKIDSKTFKRVLPFLLLIPVYLIIKISVLGSLSREGYRLDSPYLTTLVMIKAWAKYVFLLLFPFQLSFNQVISPGIFSFNAEDFDRYAVISQSLLDVQVLLSLVMLSGLLYMAVKFYKEKPIVSFGISWFFISLFPVAPIFPTAAYFKERNLYLAIYGFCLVLGYLISLVFQKKIPMAKVKREVIIFGLTLTFIFYGIRTHTRNLDWFNQKTLLVSTVQVNSKSAFLHTKLGITLIRFGEPLEALEHFEKAAQLKPDDPDIYFAMAEAYSADGSYEKEIESLKKAIEMKPDFAESYYNLAGAYAYLGQGKQAQENLAKAVEIYRKQGRMLEAADQVETFIGFFKARREIFKSLSEDLKQIEK